MTHATSNAMPGFDLRVRIASIWRTWRDPRTPLLAKALLVGVVLYLLFPLDIISDLLPVVGWVDDAMILPLGIAAFEALARRRRPVP